MEHRRPLTEAELVRARELGRNIDEVWRAERTTARDRKRLLRCLIEEVQLRSEKKRYLVRIIWKGGATTERDGVQVSEAIFDTFDWRAGSFGFFDDIPAPDYAVTLQMDLQNLIMEGVRRTDVRGRLAEAFPDRGLILDRASGAEHVKNSATLTPEEWQAYFLVDGRRSLAELCQIAGDPDELATLEVLHRLLQANLIAPARVSTPDAKPDLSQETVEHRPGLHGSTGEVSVELRPAAPIPHPPDDSSKIVSAKAVPYTDYVEPSAALVMGRLVMLRQEREISFPLVRDSHALGRNGSNDIVVDDRKVSAFHARIDRTRKGFVLTDLKSTNGTFVNRERVSQATLKPDDEVRLGPARLRFRLDYASGASLPLTTGGLQPPPRARR